MSQVNLRVYGNNGKLLGGGAAQLRRIKDYGGWDRYHEQFAKQVASRVTQEILSDMNQSNLKLVK